MTYSNPLMIVWGRVFKFTSILPGVSVTTTKIMPEKPSFGMLLSGRNYVAASIK